MGVQLDHYIGVFDNVISLQDCGLIIDKFERINDSSHFESFQKMKGTEQFGNGSLGRSDTSLFFEHVAKDECRYIQEKVGDCLKIYAQEYLGLQDKRLASFCCKVQRTEPKGGYHVWHSEQGPDISSVRRVLVWTLYLTTHKDSGETEFLQQGMRVAPEAGRVCIFPASFTHPHRGNPVYDKTKYIATGWYEDYYDIGADAYLGASEG